MNKNLFCCAVLFCISCFSFSVQAQYLTSNTSSIIGTFNYEKQNHSPFSKKEKKYGNTPSNVIKLGIDNFFLGRFDIAYERKINNRSSIQAEFGIGFPVKIPTRFIKSFSKDENEYFAIRANNAKWKSYSFSLDYRIYVLNNQEALNGFYVAPYLKYKPRSFKFEGEYTRPDSINLNTNEVITTINAMAEVKGGWRTFGAGVSIGYQFIINDQISIDVMPIGLGIDVHNFHLKFTTTDTDLNNNFEKWEEEVTEQVRNIPIVGNRLKLESGTDGNAKYLKAHLNFPFIAYRGGVWIGYAF